MREQSRAPIIVYIISSLALHIALIAVMAFFPKVEPRSTDRIEIQVVDRAPEPATDVQTKPLDEKLKLADQPEPLNKDIDDKAKFLSQHNQKVVKQTVAQERGEFQNKPSAQPPGEAPQSALQKIARFIPKLDIMKAVRDREAMEHKFEGDEEFRQKKNAERKPESPATQTQTKESAPVGGDVSRTLDYIKELEPGLETLLSTKEFKYYTYFARIRQQLNQHWTPRVRQKVSQIYKSGRTIASSEDMITRCLITLDRNGRLLRVQIIGDSGIRELDEAAIEAFRAAAPFPNPPKGMIDPDGTIKIRWDFILEA